MRWLELNLRICLQQTQFSCKFWTGFECRCVFFGFISYFTIGSFELLYNGIFTRWITETSRDTKVIYCERVVRTLNRTAKKVDPTDWINKSRIAYIVASMNGKFTWTYSFLTDCVSQDHIKLKFSLYKKHQWQLRSNSYISRMNIIEYVHVREHVWLFDTSEKYCLPLANIFSSLPIHSIFFPFAASCRSRKLQAKSV